MEGQKHRQEPSVSKCHRPFNETHKPSSILLTWKDVPHRSSARPAAQTCRSWSWWWQRGLPGLSRLRRWPRWIGSGRRGAEARCWTRPPTASHSSSRAGQSLQGGWGEGEDRRRTNRVRTHNQHDPNSPSLTCRPGHPWPYHFQSWIRLLRATHHTFGSNIWKLFTTQRPRRAPAVTWSCFNPAS